MQFTRSVFTQDSETAAREAISAYLRERGYEPVRDEPSLLVYQRGTANGSLYSLSPEKWQTKAVVKLAPDPVREDQTAISIVLNVNVKDKHMTRQARSMFQREMAGMIASVSGKDSRAKETGKKPAARPVATDQELYLLERRHKSGANWFYWIAGLSLVNTLMALLNTGLGFLAGLGVTQLVDAFVYGLSQDTTSEVALIIKIVGVIVNLTFAVVFVIFGILARQRRAWAFIVGMVLYALDALLFIWVQDWWSFAFHLFALWGLYGGLKAGKRLAESAA